MEETVRALHNVMLDLFKEYPRDWVVKAFSEAFREAETHHIELDSCGREVWVKNE